MKWHPIIEGQYLFNLNYHTVGNGSSGNMITTAIQRSIELRHEPQFADVWMDAAVKYTILATHAAHQLDRV